MSEQVIHESRTIDVTPTWEGVLPILLNLITEGGYQSRKTGMEELYKMARLADAFVMEHKA